MPKSKIKSKKKIKLRKSLTPLRDKLKPLVEQANARVQELKASGVESKALYAAEKTQRKVHIESGELFTSSLKSSREINREFARLEAFLTDPTSVISGATNFNEGLTHELFGAQFRADGGYGANPEYVSEEKAKLVFEVYHKVLELEGGWERVIGYLRANNPGLTQYGSEELINAIFDMTNDLGVEDMRAELGRYDLGAEDLVDYYIYKATDLVDEIMRRYNEIAELQKFGEDYGVLEKKEERDQRLRMWEWKQQRDAEKIKNAQEQLNEFRKNIRGGI